MSSKYFRPKNQPLLDKYGRILVTAGKAKKQENRNHESEFPKDEEDMLQGGLGTINGKPITKAVFSQGSTTLTVSNLRLHPPIPTEDAECEIVPNPQKLIP